MFLILFSIFICIIIVWFIKLNFFSDIPQPWAWPYFKHYPFFFFNGDDIDSYAKLSKPFYKYGLYKCDVLSVPEHVVLLDPSLPKYVLSKTEKFRRSDTLLKACPYFEKSIFTVRGEEHKWQKKLLSRLFTTERHEYYIKIMNRHVDILIQQISDSVKEIGDDGVNIDVLKMFRKLAFEILAGAVFNYDAKEDNYRFVQLCEKVFVSNMSKSAVLLNVFPFLNYFNIGVAKERKEALEEARQIVEEMLNKRKEEISRGELSEEKKNDFLSCVLEAECENRKMDDTEVFHNVFQMCIAGFETTSVAMMFMAYAFGVHRDCQSKARDEAHEICGNNNFISFDNIQQLPYVDMFLKEVLRYYNSPIRIGRIATENCKLGNYFVRKGQMIKTVLSLFHMNPSLHPEPEKFKPERFRDEALTKNGHWLAFGYGPYMCIGKQFAMNEMKILTAKLLQNFEMTVDEENRYFKRAIRIGVCPTKTLFVRFKRKK